LRHVDKKQQQRQDWNKNTTASKTNKTLTNGNSAIDIEEGIKIVSQDSIDKIRQAGGESFNFNFKTKQQVAASKPYLPLKQQAPQPPSALPPPTTISAPQPVPPIVPPTPPPKIDTIDNSSSGPRDPPPPPAQVPVGIIKPIARAVKDEPINKKQQIAVEQKTRQTIPTVAPPSVPPPAVPAPSVPPPPPTIMQSTTPNVKPRAESPTTTLNNLINLTKQNNVVTKNSVKLQSENSSTGNNKKEVILIDKPQLKKEVVEVETPPLPQQQPLEPILKVQSKGVFASNKIVTFAEDIDEKRFDNITAVTKDNSDEGIDYDEDVDAMKSNYRDSWKKRQDAETKNTMVFNFLNSQKDVTHIENDGLDLSKRKKKKHLQQLAKESGVVILRNGGLDHEDDDEGVDEEVESDSDSGLGGSVPPCSVTFIGANVSTGKSSMRSKSRDKKRNITFSESLTQVFEYPSFESSVSTTEETDNTKTKSGITTNKNPLGSFGGLGSYTPSKMADTPFQLGVTRTVPHASSNKQTNNDNTKLPNINGNNAMETEEVLRPTEDAISWSGSSSSSDMLF